MITPVFTGRVNDADQIKLDRPEEFERYRRQFKGKPIELILRGRKSQRSSEQNRWLWGVALELLVTEFGYDTHEQDRAKEDLHYHLVETCFGNHWDARLKKQVPNVRSSHLSPKEFANYMEWLVRYAAQHYSVIIPLPNESEAG